MINILSYFCLFLGLVFIIISIVGYNRLPDYFSKMHSSTLGDALGAPIFIIGLALQSSSLIFAFKMALLSIILLIVNPTASYFLNKFAIRKGLNINGEEK